METYSDRIDKGLELGIPPEEIAEAYDIEVIYPVLEAAKTQKKRWELFNDYKKVKGGSWFERAIMLAILNNATELEELWELHSKALGRGNLRDMILEKILNHSPADDDKKKVRELTEKGSDLWKKATRALCE